MQYASTRSRPRAFPLTVSAGTAGAQRRQSTSTGTVDQWSAKRAEALSYVERGWALVPLLPRSKKPHPGLLPEDNAGKASWSLLRHSPASSREVEEWLRRDPDCNLGVLCGQSSGGLAVIDIDISAPEGVELPITPTVETGRGKHLYLRTSRSASTTPFEWGEIRGDGAYVVVPPSVHPGGAHYTWVESQSPAEVALAELDSCEHLLSAFKTDVPDPRAVVGQAVRAARVGDSGRIDGTVLRRLFSEDHAVLAIARSLGAPADVKVGRPFCCVLPGHAERIPSASLLPNREGVIVYHDWHAREGVRVYTLPMVRAAQAYGHTVELSKSEQATWALRLLVEAGLAEPVRVDSRALPLNVRASVRRVYEGLLFLLGVRWLYDHGAAAPFSWRFASAWCGLSERHAGEAIKELLRLELIKAVGKHARTTLFLPS